MAKSKAAKVVEAPKTLTLDEKIARAEENVLFAWDWALREAKAANEVLGKFHARLAEDPISELEWADKAFQAAGTMFVHSKILRMRNDSLSAREMLAVAQDEVHRGAKYGHHSSSTSSNLMAHYKLSAWASATESLSAAARCEDELASLRNEKFAKEEAEHFAS